MAAMPEPTELIGQRIRQARLAAGLAQEDLAHAVGCRVTQVSRWERGLNAPSADAIVSLAKALRASTVWLLTGEDDVTAAVRPSGRVPPRDEILAPDPAHPGWADFLDEAKYLARSLPDWALYAVKVGPPQFSESPPAAAYIELAEAYKRLQDGRMTVTVL